ncbi:hypothetical protein [Sinorhizobium saheli]|nr:hypothetical protein [Sinorhizobium saheli]MQW86260.1 hypothetical protein [Sinorhizobium saheli]
MFIVNVGYRGKFRLGADRTGGRPPFNFAANPHWKAYRVVGTGPHGRERDVLAPGGEFPMERRGDEPAAISPDAVEMLGKLFDQILDEHQIPREGERAEDLAARLIAIYRSGVRDLELLKKLAMRSRS